jgi:hypothetical protein
MPRYMIESMVQPSLYPRGNALTDSMPFTDRDGVSWLVYIDGIPSEPTLGRLWRKTTMPGRRLRFDSTVESRISIDVPAGSPYLPAAQLQHLLEHAQPQGATRRRLPRGPDRRQATRASSADLQRRREADRRPLRYRLEEFLSAVVSVTRRVVDVILSGWRWARH